MPNRRADWGEFRSISLIRAILRSTRPCRRDRRDGSRPAPGDLLLVEVAQGRQHPRRERLAVEQHPPGIVRQQEPAQHGVVGVRQGDAFVLGEVDARHGQAPVAVLRGRRRPLVRQERRDLAHALPQRRLGAARRGAEQVRPVVLPRHGQDARLVGVEGLDRASKFRSLAGDPE